MKEADDVTVNLTQLQDRLEEVERMEYQQVPEHSVPHTVSPESVSTEVCNLFTQSLVHLLSC